MFNKIFDELKEEKYFKEVTDFKSAIMETTLTFHDGGRYHIEPFH